MKSTKILIILLIICFIVFFISNIKTINTIDDYAFVIALGIDSSESGLINLSLQIAIPTSGSEESSNSQSSSSIVNTIQCETIDSGINQFNSYLNKSLNFSYCKAVVFSEEYAQKGIGDEISTFMNNIEIRPSCNIVICENTAKNYLEKSNPLLEKLSSKYYEIEKSSEKNTGFTQCTTIIEFYNNLFSSKSEPYAILSKIEEPKNEEKNNSKESSDQEIKTNDSTSKIVSNGLAVFKNDKYIGNLTPEENVIHLILTNNLNHTIINIPSPFESNNFIALDISKTHTKSKIDFYNNTSYIKSKINLNCKILSSSQKINYMDNENVKKIEDFSNKYFSYICGNYLKKVSHDFNSDIDHFGEIASRKYLDNNNWNKNNWLENFKTCKFRIDVNTHVKSSYLVLN